MSIEPFVAAARAAIDALIDDMRRSAAADAPTILIRIGQIETRVATAEALARTGDPTGAALIAAAAIRLIARDFHGRPLPSLDLLAEDAACRRIAEQELTR